MRRLTLILAAAAALLALGAAPAQAAFGLKGIEVGFEDEGGAGVSQAGSHPFALSTYFAVNTKAGGGSEEVPDEEAKDVIATLPAGLAGTPTPGPRCASADFLLVKCSPASAVGTAHVEVTAQGTFKDRNVYNLIPPPGAAAKLGFQLESVFVTVEVGVSPDPPYNLIATSTDILSQVYSFYSARISLWGVPADPAHDSERCIETLPSCEAVVQPKPFLTLPRACTGPLPWGFQANSWEHPGSDPFPFQETVHSPEMSGCSALLPSFAPSIAAAPTSRSASSPSGLDFDLTVKDEGLTSSSYEALATSDIEKAEVTLPEGMTINPSQAEGLGACTEAQLAAERPDSGPGQGCPEDAKVGTVEVETPLLEGTVLHGSLYVAKPYENLADNSLIALYMVIKDPTLGILLKLPGRVAPDPQTGQLISTFEDLPQQPFSHFHLHFREGGRSPLATPPRCGTFTTRALLTPWAGAGSPYETDATFAIDSGPGGGPCPPAGAPFAPGLAAGPLTNAAKAYAPFSLRLTRKDGEQDITRFSSVLPPGILARIAGLSQCPQAAVAAARARSGPHGGAEELASPSCPASSLIGRVSSGAGVGPELTYVPGSLYLGGPYHGDPLSAIAIVPALAGPFDVGTVVVQVALRLNPISAEVEVDGAASDPIPHILKGIPLSVREIEVYADRPDFTLNATSCEPSSTRATIWGGGSDPFSTLDDAPVGAAARYQAAGCASLGFAPKLAIKLKGGTRRGRFPALKAVVTPRPQDANFSRAVVTLPHSAFLEQGHFGTICTRVQFAANGGNGAGCPAASIYGRARAWTPLLAQPAEGPVYLRSSDHNLPDLVVALKGPPEAPFPIDLAARIDSRHGGIRSSFEAIPDVPVNRFILEMQGGRKGLIVNSTDICKGKHRAKAKIRGQNGRLEQTSPVVRAISCKRHKKHAKHSKKHKPHHKRRA